MSTDHRFFTNTPEATLADRFRSTLRGVQFFDVLVGYFRTSGFYHIWRDLESVEHIRILVGINVDANINRLFDQAQVPDSFSHKETKKVFSETVSREFDTSEDSVEMEEGARKFIEFLRSGKMELKAYPHDDIHAKVYISRYPGGIPDFGRVITGSSNFSHKGLKGQLEFNVELKDSHDVKRVLEHFEELWVHGVDISKEYVDTVTKKTWLSDDITPYELYLKFLYEYFQEDLAAETSLSVAMPEGYKELLYQKDAVTDALKILAVHGGVFLADVVGLGKTFIASLLAQQLPGQKLVVCPPHLIQYWEDTLRRFGVAAKVQSLGKLEHLLEEGVEEYKYVFIDEAHRFRNEMTQAYEKLIEICAGKKIILVSATPLNNYFSDIANQIKLFQKFRRSTIPGEPNLEKFFAELDKKVNTFKKDDPEYLPNLRQASEILRDKLFRHIMVRRTRSEIVKFYGDDMKKENLFFPDIAKPERFAYRFDKNTEKAFLETISLIGKITYSRYTPGLYLNRGVDQLESQRQKNLGGFMKGILVKRLESSSYAFRCSVDRFIASYEKFISMYRKGTVYISKKVDVYDYLENDQEEELIRMAEEDGERITKYKSSEFNEEMLPNLQKDLKTLRQIRRLWAGVKTDPKLKKFTEELASNSILKEKIIVFTESTETGDYLYRELSKKYPTKVCFYSSMGAVLEKRDDSVIYDRDIIRQNYDPNYAKQKDDIRILITTDVLAEGINLHRSNVVVNYDLPWNPTRVLQRVGRVNRVGTKHKKIHIVNFFPTTQSDEHLGLERNIVNKLQAFHDTLGEDAKYLSETEVFSSHKLFGNEGERQYKQLNDPKTYEGAQGEPGRSPLEFVKLLRTLRDTKSELFARIKALPRKARTARAQGSQQLVTFFRQGYAKRFFASNNETTHELTFDEAESLLRCDDKTKRENFPSNYFDLLAKNKRSLHDSMSEEPTEKISGSTNEAYIVRRLNDKAFRTFTGFTDGDEEFVDDVRSAFEVGAIPKNTIKRLRTAIETIDDPLKVVAILRKEIKPAFLTDHGNKDSAASSPKEIVLSEYLV